MRRMDRLETTSILILAASARRLLCFATRSSRTQPNQPASQPGVMLLLRG